MQILSPHVRRVVTLFLIGIIISGCIRLPATGAGTQRSGAGQQCADGQRSAASPRSGAIPDGPRIAPQKTVVAGVQVRAPEVSLKSSLVLVPACVAGDWQFSDLAGVLRGAYEESQNGQTLSLDSVDGQIRYHFDPSGALEIRYQQLAVTLSGTLDGQPVTVQQALDGSANANYVVDTSAGSLVVTDFGGEGVQYAFDINGQRLAEGELPAWRAFVHALSGGLALTPSPLVRYSRLAITCGEDTLTLRPVEPYTGPEVELVRVED